MSDHTPMGVICINKHEGVTSHTIVNIIRKLYNTKQVGHTGTLDPLATGVLPVMIGRAVKASEYLTAEDKEYVAKMKLGITTDSEDITGKIISKCDIIPSYETVKKVVESFIGNIKQIPPMYSAIKVNGYKLVDLARKGIDVERNARDICIKDIKLIPLDSEKGLYELNVRCSKGTYIRTLCSDIGSKLGCGAVMTSLCRTKCGSFILDNSYTIKQLEEMNLEQRYGLLVSVENLFSDLDNITLPPFYEKLAKNGLEIYLKKIGADQSIKEGTRFKLYSKNGFFALGEVREYESGKAIKPLKQFVI